MASSDLETRIAQAIAKSKYKWRTVRGIAKEVDVDEQQVSRALENSGTFLRATRTNERGDALYTTAERYRRETSLMTRLLGAAANTVYDD